MRLAGTAPRRHAGPSVLAVDVGTSAIRVSAVSPDGEVLHQAVRSCRHELAGELAEIDLEALWDDVAALVRQVSRDAGPPAAVGVACQIGTAFVDETLAPVGPGLLWQDRRASAEAAELAGAFDGRERELAGRRATPELAGPRALWMSRSRPGDWARARWVLTLKDFLVARLTGTVVTDPTSASYTLLFDVHEWRWSEELASAAGVPLERLPPIRGAAEAVGPLLARVASELGLPPETLVSVGGPDGTVGVLGSGAASGGVTVDVAGTTDVVIHTSDRPAADPDSRSILNAFLFSGLWGIGGPTGMTGGALTWLARVLGHASVEEAYAALGAELSSVPPGAGGVTFATGLTGERFPTWRTDAAGTLGGLRPEHTAAHLLRAGEEGAAFVVRQGLEALAATGLEMSGVRVCGGTARRRENLQLRANAWRRPVVGVRTLEATTVGAAILAAVCGRMHAGVAEAVDAMVRLEPPIDPVAEVSDRYDDAYARWCAAQPPDHPQGFDII